MLPTNPAFPSLQDLSDDHGQELIIHEDEDLLVVNKPAGWNTHSPEKLAGEGIYEWLRNRQPRWAQLAIIHRLDKATSGVLLFAKSRRANQSLTEQFSNRSVRKVYRLRSTHKHAQSSFEITLPLTVQGAKNNQRSATTRFEFVASHDGFHEYRALPATGRTHQVRIHAAHAGIPVLGDTEYGDKERSRQNNRGQSLKPSGTPRLMLHAAELVIQHPASGTELRFEAALPFIQSRSSDQNGALDQNPAGIRAAIISPQHSNAWRSIHGAADGRPQMYADMLAERILLQSAAEEPLTEKVARHLHVLYPQHALYIKQLRTQPGSAPQKDSSPQLWRGEVQSDNAVIRENAVEYELRFNEGYSVGLFLDQRDNRRRILCNYVKPGFSVFDEQFGVNTPPTVLNTFAYTCAFSLCAALAGAQTVSLDLSRKYLDWGKRNFELNNLDPAAHEFLYGDVFEWLKIFGRRSRTFDLVILDPPTFSRSKRGVFRVAKDIDRLIQQALAVLNKNGVLLVGSNAYNWQPKNFLEAVRDAVQQSGRKLLNEHYQSQPPDFGITRDEPAYLKTVWLKID